MIAEPFTLLIYAGPRVAEAIFAHVTSAASTVASTAIGRRFEDRRLVVGLWRLGTLWHALLDCTQSVSRTDVWCRDLVVEVAYSSSSQGYAIIS